MISIINKFYLKRRCKKMGFIKAFTGSLSSTFADQWQDFYMPMPNVPATAGLYPAVQQRQNNDKGENTKGNENIISNGSKIIVPENTALITMQDGAITGCIVEPGGFIYNSEDPNSQSFFGGDGLFLQTIKSTWDKVKFGGQPGAQQLVFYVNLKEIPNNKFGTQSEIYWDDAYFGTQVGCLARGSYSLMIKDPLLFVKNFVPAKYLQPDAPVFDFADMDNESGTQLFNEVVGTLAAAFSNYTNDPDKGNRISRIQGDQLGFGKAMGQAVEDAYQWKSNRGLEIVSSTIMSIEYDEDTKELMKDVKKADALSGARGNSFMQQSVARGMQAAGENGGGANMAFMGMGMNAAGGMMGGVQQPNNPSVYQQSFAQGAQQPTAQPAQAEATPAQPAQPAVDPTTKLLEMKKLLDAGAITQEDYDKVKKIY
jgi:Putative virion core protein (lumpy skin disease virus)